MLSFKPAFSLSFFTFIKRLFSFSLLFSIRVMSSAYLRLLIFPPAILISACASSSPAFYMMYSACKLNKQGDNIYPWRTPFPIWKQSFVPNLKQDRLWFYFLDFSRSKLNNIIFNLRQDKPRSQFWPPATKSWLIGKVPGTEKDWAREDKQETEDEMVI